MRCAALLLALATGASAWGPAGHAITARLASERLSAAARDGVRALLSGNGDNTTLESVASWADDARETPAFNWSTPLHYINTPDWACDFVPERDCAADFCVWGAIQNYSSRMVDASLDLVERRHALEFVTHFVGDIHQPLHVSFKSDQGGNLLLGTFFGNISTNLHAVWDFDMIRRNMALNFGGDRDVYADHISGLLNGTWAADAAAWAACDPARNATCITAYANEGARLTCTHGEVSAAGGHHIRDHFALAEPYYARNIPVVTRRLAQGGVRLARLLNSLFATAPPGLRAPPTARE